MVLHMALPVEGGVAFVDNTRSMDLFFGLPVYHIRDIEKLQYDKIVVLNGQNAGTLRAELLYGYGIDGEKIEYANYLLRNRILQKYENSDDPEIQRTLSNLRRQNHFDLWCGYCPRQREQYEVIWDKSTAMPYVMYEGKRIYYPRDKKFAIREGKQYVSGLEFEQQEGSPHLYLTEHHQINKGDVLIDAGVCEGNFAIRFIDIVSKVYLVECDPKWKYPLMLTFRDYMDKVIFVPRFLGSENSDDKITLDKLLDGERCDFIKMDIEGAEVDALSGGEMTFRNNDIRCSICSYHRHGDEESIRNILSRYGYETEASSGHMIFPYEKERFKWSEIRHGVVYGKKSISDAVASDFE